MDRRTKIVIVIAIVAIGAALALEFRKRKSGDASAVSAGNTPPASGIPVGETVHAARPSFDGHIEPDPASAPESGQGSGYQPVSPVGMASSARDDAPVTTGSLVDINAPEERHQIADGDTLPRIAERYLGSSDYWQALYAYNRDVLKDPDVLPIGAELRIPPKYILPPLGVNQMQESVPQAALPGGTNLGTPSSSGAASPKGNVPPMVNVPPAPQKISFNSTSAKAPTGTTYTVQAGESLLDVAKKVYGDPRRYQDLFEANRRQLRTPSDMKVGMVLVVP